MSKDKKQLTEEQKKEVAFGVKLRLAHKQNDYIKNIINGRYYLARVNMIAKQLNEKNILENLDGCPKTEEYMRAEYALMKMQAIVSMRNAHFAKQDLMKDFQQNEEDIHALEEDYYDGKVIREEYDEVYKRKNKAEFVNTPKD